ncbi:MAG: sulfatase [Roseibacillus sp.]
MFRNHLFLFLLPLIAGGEERPNIVYINADDLGWSDLGVQGSTYYETPNLDQLAASGIRFTNGYAAAANCAPSRACAMSGQWPQRHGIYTVGSSERGKSKDRKLIPTPNNETLADEVITLPEVLQDAGYFTAHVGKWHLTEDPLTQGFDVNIAGFHGGSPSKGGYHSPYHYPNIKNNDEGEYLTDRLAQEATKIITEKKDNPFFLSFTTYTVHTPIQGRKDLVEKFNAKESNKHHNNAKYAAMICSLDMAVGRIISTLEKHNLLEKTLIIFTSDNGGHSAVTSNAPLRAGKGSYYEGGIREPFFFSWQGRIEPGQINDTPIANLDLFPTIIAAAKAKVPPKKILDGQSLLPLLTEGKPLPERTLYWHFPVYLQAYKKNDLETRDPIFRTRPGSVIRSGNWKLHHYFENDDIELYNLKDDPSEQVNLAPANQEQAKALLLELSEWRTETKAPIPSTLNPEYKPNKKP